MAQKRRGLGRGLQALIPDTQLESPNQRPSDVFFPAGHRPPRSHFGGGTLTAEPVRTAPDRTSVLGDRQVTEVTAALLAPKPRRRSGGGRKAAATGTTTDVSRETPVDSQAPKGAAGSDGAVQEPQGRSEARPTGSRVEGPTTTNSTKSLTPSSAETSSATGEGAVPDAAPALGDGAPGKDGRDAGGVTASVPEVKAAVDRASDAGADSSGGGADAPDGADALVAKTGSAGNEAGTSVGEAPAVVSKASSSTAQSASSKSGAAGSTKRVSRETSRPDGEVDPDGLVPVPGATYADLPLDAIVPNRRQPRQVFDEDEIAELVASMKEVGLLQPIVVRRIDEGSDEGDARYELIMGERRLRAAKAAGFKKIPAIVRYIEDEDLLRDALLENLHRVQLNPLEEAAAYQQLLDDFSCTHEELSRRIARSRSQISNTLRLMKLPPLVQRRVAAGVLSAGHARALLGLPDAAAMERLAQRIVAEGLSVRATEEAVALHDEPAKKRKSSRARAVAMTALATRLSDTFDTRVKVVQGAKKGRITIEFAGKDDLARIIEALAPGTSLQE